MTNKSETTQVNLTMETNKNQQAGGPSIRHVLVRRLIYATLAVILVVAIVVGALEQQRVIDAVVNRSLQRTAQFIEQNQSLLDVQGGPDRVGLQRALAQLASNRLKERMGYFVYAEIYDAAQVPISENIDRDFYKINEVMEWREGQPRPAPAALPRAPSPRWRCPRCPPSPSFPHARDPPPPAARLHGPVSHSP